MRLVHFADLHLGIENYGSLNPRTGVSTRIDDFLASFDRVIDYAITHEADAVLFAGDAFKNRDPNPTLQRAFASRIQCLAKAGVPTVLLIGNHDLPSISARATAIDIYEALEVPNIMIGRTVRTLRVETKSGPLQVVTLPWVSRSQLLTNDELRKLSADELQRRTAELISSGIAEEAAKLDPAAPAVLLAHISVEGAKLGSEQSIMLGQELVLGPDELNASLFDYVALGHIHRHQNLGSNPPIVYSGSIERIDFGEEREAKGFVVVEIDSRTTGQRSAQWQFHPLDTRPFVTIRVNATSEHPLEEVRIAIERRAKEIQGAIVRVAISLPPEREDLLRLEDVRKLLLEHRVAWVARIIREVESQNRPRVDIRQEEALDPVKMLDRWLGLRDLPEERREKLREAGLNLIHQRNEQNSG